MVRFKNMKKGMKAKYRKDYEVELLPPFFRFFNFSKILMERSHEISL